MRNDIDFLKGEVIYLRKYLEDEILTDEDKIRISKSIKDYKNKETITFDELEAKRNKNV